MLAILCTSLFGFLIFALGMKISQVRSETKMHFGFNFEDPTDYLHKLVRAHDNLCQYAPILSILMFYVEYRCATFVVSEEIQILAMLLIMTATTSRVLLTYSLLTCDTLAKSDNGRIIGSWGQYMSGLALSALALYV